jgi:hypothetical protein
MPSPSRCFLVFAAVISVVDKARAAENCLEDFIHKHVNATVLECCDPTSNKTIPDSVSMLPQLTEISLSECAITGTIPQTVNWGLLTELRTL